MKKTIKYLMLTLVAVFACVAISSCSKDDDDDPNKGIGNYYVVCRALISIADLSISLCPIGRR